MTKAPLLQKGTLISASAVPGGGKGRVGVGGASRGGLGVGVGVGGVMGKAER